MSTAFSSLYSTLGFTFNNEILLKKALTHRSKDDLEHNERLEFLGDAVLNLIITDLLFKRFPDQREGQLTYFRAALVNGKNLATLAKQLKLNNHLMLGAGEIKRGHSNSNSILANAVEAIIGAIYLDAGMSECQKIVTHWFNAQIHYLSTQDSAGKDAKTQLQEYLQALKSPLPTYKLIKITGKSHCKHFFVQCQVKGLTIQTTGNGTSRRKAEQMAAKAFLAQVKDL